MRSEDGKYDFFRLMNPSVCDLDDIASFVVRWSYLWYPLNSLREVLTLDSLIRVGFHVTLSLVICIKCFSLASTVVCSFCTLSSPRYLRFAFLLLNIS